MANVHDVAAYILQKRGMMTAMKLQKLVYYSQAWGLVWDDEPMFDDRIEAWANGPVSPALYYFHRGQFQVAEWPQGNANSLTKDERETVDAVLEFYGDKSSSWLSELTHSERPWIEARTGLKPGERGDQVIPQASMAEYYGGLH